MKKIYLFFLCFLSCFIIAKAQQDAGVTAITSPTTGCSLSATEPVSIKIFNYGTDLSTVTFDLSYRINGGPIQTDNNVSFASFLSNSTKLYTFTTTANLSTPGTYNIEAWITLTGDINKSNDSSKVAVNSDSPSIGGTVINGTDVCINSNSGALNLIGETGSILNWSFSTDGGVSWINISNNTNTQSYVNLNTQTLYRVNIKNGSCPVAYSTPDTIFIDPKTVAGNTAAPATVCSISNSGTINLSGETGSVNKWQFSTDGGSTWSNIVNTGTSQNYNNLNTTTDYRAQVQSGACPAKLSSVTTITVDTASVGGNLASNASVCAGTNSGTLTLSGDTGSVVGWQYSQNGGATWNNISNTTNTHNYGGLTLTTLYRVKVKNGVCPQVVSDTVTITVSPASVGGNVASNNTVCISGNSGTLNLSGQTGVIQKWQFSTDGGSTWSDIVNGTNAQNYLNLTQTTEYRAMVKNGGCPTDSSSNATITVSPVSVGGFINGSATVCGGTNSGTLNLVAQTGSVLKWQYSQNNGVTWTNISNTTTSENYNNLNADTWYRAFVKSGACSSDTSDTAKILMGPTSIGGNVILNDTVCSGSNSGTLNASGYTGSIVRWQFSTNGGVSWNNISNTTPSQNYNNLTGTRLYRINVQVIGCPTVNSTSAKITVDPVTIPGNILSGATVCATANSDTLSLNGYTGSVQEWQTSTDNGATWMTVANTTDTISYNNLPTSTWYRSIVQSGVCPTDTSDTTIITVDPTTDGGNILSDTAVCLGMNSGQVVLSNEVGSVLQWEVSTDGGASWITINNTATFQNYSNVTTQTDYRALLKSGVCPTDYSDTVTLTIDQHSIAGNIIGNNQFCAGNNIGSLGLLNTTGDILAWQSSSDSGSTWNNIVDTISTLNFNSLMTNTWYRAIAKNGVCPADTSNTFVVMINPTPVAGFMVLPVCLGDTSIFTDTSSISNGSIVLHQWNFGDGSNTTLTNPSHIYASSGTHNVTLVVLSDKGCSDTAMAVDTVYAIPNISLNVGSEVWICPADSINIMVSGSYSFTWNTGDTTNSITVDSAGTYLVTATDSNGCMASDSTMLSIYPAATADAGLDTSVSLGSSVMLMGSGGMDYQWSPDSNLDNALIPNPMATPDSDTYYILTITDANGCTDTDGVNVKVIKDFKLVISNLITANGDGYNDAWYIGNIINYPKNEVMVMNRYGQEVYSASSYQNDWKGTYKGKTLPDGTYYYIIKFSDSNEILKGAVNIVSGSK